MGIREVCTAARSPWMFWKDELRSSLGIDICRIQVRPIYCTCRILVVQNSVNVTLSSIFLLPYFFFPWPLSEAPTAAAAEAGTVGMAIPMISRTASSIRPR